MDGHASNGILLKGAGAKLHTSVPVVIETFTFLDRNANRDVGVGHGGSEIYRPGTVMLLSCELADLEQSWAYFQRADLRRLSAVDATSFAIMKRARIRIACYVRSPLCSSGVQARDLIGGSGPYGNRMADR